MSKMKGLLKQNSHLVSVGEEIHNLLSEEEYQIQKKRVVQQINLLSNPEYSIAVLGTWNSGKSSVLNRLLFESREILPVADRPMTQEITLIRKGPPSLSVHRIFKGVETIATGEKEVLEQLHSLSTVETEGGNLILEWDADLLKSGVVAIDTPGLEDENAERSGKTKNYIDQCNATIIVSTLQNSLTNDLKQFLKKKVFERNQEKFFFLINKCDRYDPEDGEETPEEMADYVAGQIAEISGLDIEVIKQRIFCVSAKTGAGFDSFEEAFAQFLLSTKTEAVIQLVQGNLSQVIKELEFKISIKEAAMSAGKKEVQARYENKKKVLKQFESGVQYHLDIMNDEFERLKKKARGKFSQLVDTIKKELEDIKSGGKGWERLQSFAVDRRLRKTKAHLDKADLNEEIDDLQRSIQDDIKRIVDKFNIAFESLLKEFGEADAEITREFEIKEGLSSPSGVGLGGGVAGSLAIASILSATGGLFSTVVTTTTTTASTLPWIGNTAFAGWLAGHGVAATTLSTTVTTLGGITSIATYGIPGIGVLISATICVVLRKKGSKKIDQVIKDVVDELTSVKRKITDYMGEMGNGSQQKFFEAIEKEKASYKCELEALLESQKNQKLSDSDQKIKDHIAIWAEQLALGEM